MKKKNLRYSLGALALIALIIGVISSATEIRPTQRETQQESVETSTPPVTPPETTAIKKKACGCCAERIARLQERIRKAREHRQLAQQASAAEASQQQSSRASAAP